MSTSTVRGRVGLVGLGLMGRGMARNLLRSGVDLVVWNRTRHRAEALSDDGAALATTPRELGAVVDVLLLCVSTGDDVEQVLFGEDGAADGLRAGALVVDCSTISPRRARSLSDRLARADIAFIDAPVSGGSEGAEQGTLAIMAGGRDADVERARPLFDAIGRKTTHVGPVGAGQTAKLVNQILVVGNMLAISEGLLLAEASGLDLERTIEAVADGAAGSWMLSNRGTQAVRRDWRPGFTVDLQQKDLRLVLETADELGVPLPGTASIFQLYRTLQARGLGGEGNHALVKALEALADRRVGGPVVDGAPDDR
ncbi:MAG: NAD(P)-dependent oxidoreductase [Acidobacteriota bacterium]